jgi:methylated-DNA-[protein]-cysteine S-methyltransferase
MRWRELATPMGGLGIAVDEIGVCRIHFDGAAGAGGSAGGGWQPADPLLDRAVEQLEAYFATELTEFDLPLSVPRGSAFDRAVWHAIAAIPYGEMRTYGQIATDIGEPDAARAVGVACNRNPLPIVVPCHRVVGAGGKLVGFGGGLPRKRFLLELEANVRILRDFA